MQFLPAARTWCLRGSLAVGVLLGAAQSHAQPAGDCGPIALPGHYGPYDYVGERGRVPIVEQFHFTPKVEGLVGGESGYLGSDLSYTLNAIPNHHRALAALIRWHQRTGNPHPPHLRISIECFFDRAVRFRPKDIATRILYSVYLNKLGKAAAATQQLDTATEVAGDDPNAHNSIGLAYLELGNHDAALREAHAAIRLGLTDPPLMERLKAAGKWKDPD
jgi:tetratricopeptide (TPR) repeat protein